MLNVNFVPDDYVQSTESRRTNLIYFVLLAMVMAAIGCSFMTIKMRQRKLTAEEKLVDAAIAQKKEAIKQAEEIQAKSITMWKTALTTVDLLEPVPRSVLLASLTNNLPPGVSFLRLELVQKQPTKMNRPGATTKYKAAQTKKTAKQETKLSPERLLETHISIEGIAPSDLEVAALIERLSNSTLLDNVALVESKEHKITKGNADKETDKNVRRFKLTAMLRKNVHLTSDDIREIADSGVYK